MNFTAHARVQFATPEHAAIAARSLAVDDELQPTKAAKEFTTEGPVLVGCVRARARARLGALALLLRRAFRRAPSIDRALAPSPCTRCCCHAATFAPARRACCG